MSINWLNLVVDMPTSVRITSRSQRAQAALSGLLPHPDLDRGLTQRLGQIRDLGLELLFAGREPGLAPASAVLPASRKSAFHRPIDCSLTFSRRAASATLSSPAITLNASRVFFSAGIEGWVVFPCV
jgi:hypothetical protein